MITKERAIELGSAWGQATLFHVSLTNSDGTALRCRVNGKCKTWKRDESRWELPVKHGLRDCGYISPDGPSHMRPEMWVEVEPVHAKELAKLVKLSRLAPETPLPIVIDALRDAGKEWEADRLASHTARWEGEEEYLDSDDDCEDEETPQEGDLVTQDGQTFYLVNHRRPAFTVGEDEDRDDAIRRWMDENQYWPNAWSISDHGNAHRIEL